MGLSWNAAAAIAMCAFFTRRVIHIGFTEALAEALGLSELHAYWATAYWPLQPDLFRNQPSAFWLDPDLVAALVLHNATRRAQVLTGLVRNHGHGVYSFPLLRDEAARRLAREIDHFVWSGHVSAWPNSMNQHGIVLSPDGLDGLDALIHLLVANVLSPLAAVLFASDELDLAAAPIAAAARVVRADACCSSHHAFAVRYNESEQRGLDAHHDDSDVTLNICLSRDEQPAVPEAVEAEAEVLEAAVPEAAVPEAAPSDDEEGGIDADLRFCGLVGDEAHRRRSVGVRHAVGRAVIHLGAHRHSARELSHGARQNLIVWGKRRAADGAHGRDEAAPRGGATRLHPAELPPDLECLSYTNDVDYEPEYTARGVALPPAARAHFEQRRAQAELVDLASRATDEHIEMLPEHHRPIVRLLRQAAGEARADEGEGT